MSFRSASKLPAGASRDAPSLADMLRQTQENRWRGMRSEERNVIEATIALAALDAVVRGGANVPDRTTESRVVSRVVKRVGIFDFTITTGSLPPIRPTPGEGLYAWQVEQHHVRQLVRKWDAEGFAPATVVIRLTCLSVLGVNVKGCYPRLPRKLKFWLRPEQEAMALEWLARQQHPRFAQLANLIRFITKTGLRIEEALRLTWSDVVPRPNGRVVIAVGGLKTKGAQRTLPVSAAAVEVLEGQRGVHPTLIFPLPYHQMNIAWGKCRLNLGLEDPKAATLKMLRRNAARNLTVNGMPSQMLMQYLGHSKIETTLGYLKLTGGYNEEEFGKWL